jgi:prepilin-type N-terminal cleavage/methylation domain-containing protein
MNKNQFLRIQNKQIQINSSQEGFTIIESLVAIIVVGILLSAISPAIVLAFGNRVQASRSYIDGVTTGAIAAPPQVATASTTSLLGSTPPLTSINNVSYCMNRDNTLGCQATSPNDLVIQSFRTNNPNLTSYTMGVRVYRADAFKDTTPLKTNGSPVGGKVTQNSVNGGLGDRKAPLVELVTEIYPSTSNTQPSFSDFCARLRTSNPTPTNNSTCN